jgi:hypothetical protein
MNSKPLLPVVLFTIVAAASAQTARLARDGTEPGAELRSGRPVRFADPDTAHGAARRAAGIPGPIADGVAWLEGDQNGDGSWGSSLQMIVTSTGVDALSAAVPESPALPPAADWLSEQDAANHEFLARQLLALAQIPGFEDAAADLAAALLAVRNPPITNTALPNWPEGGWGLAPGFETDCLTTALALWGLENAGLKGGFAVISEPIAVGATNLHVWQIPSNATKVRIQIIITGPTVRLRMKQGSPPTVADPFFSLAPNVNWLITFPDNGVPFTPGTNFISIQNMGIAGSYTMTASYQTPAIDTRSLAEALNYLRQAQNVDGGWGLQRGLTTDFYTTLHVTLGLLRYQDYDFGTDLADAVAYIEGQQLGDGSFGLSGTPVPYVTALGALALIRSDAYPFSTAIGDAIAALLAQQEMDGSWDQQAYDTALAILTLSDHNQAPVAHAGAPQSVPDGNNDCVAMVTLNGSASSDIDGTIVSYAWESAGEPLATGVMPMVTLPVGNNLIQLTVTDDGGKTASALVTVSVVGSGTPSNVCSCCHVDFNCDPTAAPSCELLGGTPIPGACAPEACCLPDATCEMIDPRCCMVAGGTVLDGQACTAPESCCLADGSCETLDPLCCNELGGTPQGVADACFLTELCCLPDGSCADLAPACCLDQGGAPQGEAVVCANNDGDGFCDAGDGDDDNDGVADAADPMPFNPDVCGDSDGDTCDDCAVGADDFGPLPDADPANDGLNTDTDVLCDAGDFDDDNDGRVDIVDPQPLNPDVCGDNDADTCDDCAVGTDDLGSLPDANPANDGPDGDGDGLCDAGDPCPADNPNDSDGDGVCNSKDICPGFDDAIDPDEDGFPSGCDNCPNEANPAQADCDRDGIGDVCAISSGMSDDDDGNGIPDNCEAPLCPSGAFAECADADEDGIRDDNCLWWACNVGVCEDTAVAFADVGGQFGACTPDGTADGNDRFHALNCFSDQNTTGGAGYPCEPNPPTATNADAGGPFGRCCPDGVCDGNDAFHALNSFQGINACHCPANFQCPCPSPTQPPGNPVLCPPGPAPLTPPDSGGPLTLASARIKLHALSAAPRADEVKTSRVVIRSGATVEVQVILENALADLRGFQLHVAAGGGRRGSLQLVDMTIQERKDQVFANQSAWQAFNVRTQQLLAGLDSPGISTAPGAYLATLTFTASRDAAGTFRVDLLHDDSDPAQRTFLFPTAPGQRIEVLTTPAVIDVR